LYYTIGTISFRYFNIKSSGYTTNSSYKQQEVPNNVNNSGRNIGGNEEVLDRKIAMATWFYYLQVIQVGIGR